MTVQSRMITDRHCSGGNSSPVTPVTASASSRSLNQFREGRPKKSTEKRIHTKIHDKIHALIMKIHHDECSAEGQSWQILHCRYRSGSDFASISVTDADFGHETNEFCNHVGFQRYLHRPQSFGRKKQGPYPALFCREFCDGMFGVV